jgi:hypothetical protein
MKEFSAQTGGRYTYVDDIMNLQELSLAFASIFSECDNFILSGCEVLDDEVKPGYVYINNKLRHFPGTKNVKTWPQYIYESNRTETVAYASGTDKVGRNVYGCAISAKAPTTPDVLTGNAPASIKLEATSSPRLKDALFGRYSLLLQPQSGAQTVDGLVNFSRDVSINGALVAKGRMTVEGKNCKGTIHYDRDRLIIQSRIYDRQPWFIAKSKDYTLSMSERGGFEFTVDGMTTLQITDDGIVRAPTLTATQCFIGNLTTIGNGIYDSETALDSGALRINMAGYNGSSKYFRDTFVGDGKGKAILSILGKNGELKIDGATHISSPTKHVLTLHGGTRRDNPYYGKIITWRDVDGVQTGSIGYDASRIMSLQNSIAGIHIIGVDSVDIGPVIKEGGVLLSDRYATIQSLTDGLADKADMAEVYPRKIADLLFAKKAGGLKQFVNATHSMEQLREEIGALSLGDMAGRYPTMGQLLADMATNESARNKICENIGAARKGAFQPILKDTGWVLVAEGLYARQIGSLVCVQGRIRTAHSGTAFTLPNQIDPPAYTMPFKATVSYNTSWECELRGGSKVCQVTFCNHHGVMINFSMTYMTQK